MFFIFYNKGNFVYTQYIMSARLNMNSIRPIAWKGQTFNQVMSGIKINKKELSSTNNHNLFIPQPIEHYRREIASVTADKCARISMSVDVLLRPGGSIVHSASANANTLGVGNMTVDINLINNKTEKPGSCVGMCSNTANDARRRVRSAGMIIKKFNIAANNDTYYTSNHQYLVNRSRTIKQNEYTHFRTGDQIVTPGAPGSTINIYTPNGISHCPEVKISVSEGNNSFTYIWLDGEEITVTIPDGDYTISELNEYLRGVMVSNYHYIRDIITSTFICLLSFKFDLASNCVQIQCYAADKTIFPEPRYLRPKDVIIFNTGNPSVFNDWVIPDVHTVVPNIRILSNNGFGSVIGFSPGLYPSAQIESNTYKQPSTAATTSDNIYYDDNWSLSAYSGYGATQGGNQFFFGSVNPKITEPFIPLYYKPSNSKFATQGGVDSGSRLARLKYDTITNSANSFRTAFGNQTANSLAYGVPNPGPTNNQKDKQGYPNTCSPVINPRTGEISKCKTSRIGW